MRTEPGRTPKGKKLPGHMGSKVVTLKNVEVVFYSAEEGVIAVKGGVPGSTGGLLFV
jgi:large subunit ribosomal protein L3